MGITFPGAISYAELSDVEVRATFVPALGKSCYDTGKRKAGKLDV
jgi:hypothetical protein